MSQQFHYRYMDDVGEYGVKVELVYYLVLRETPKGFWVSRIWGFFFDDDNPTNHYHDPQYYEDSKVWVSKTSTKRKAYPTKEEAYTNFLYRKQRQVKILSARLRNAEVALKIAETKKLELIQCESAQLERPSKFAF